MSFAPDTGMLGEKRFRQFVSAQLPEKTLEELTGDHFYATKHRKETGLMQRVRIAWTKPCSDLTCAEVRMLTGQKLGLEWLAAPIIELVSRYPSLECDLYPGDLAANALTVWRELHELRPRETERMIASDFRFLEQDEDAENPISIICLAVGALHEARAHLTTS